MEVVYGASPDAAMIADAAVQEDVDLVGLSILSGAHNTLFPAVLANSRPGMPVTFSSLAEVLFLTTMRLRLQAQRSHARSSLKILWRGFSLNL